MAFSIIVVIGYILVEQPFKDNQTIVGNIVVTPTTTRARPPPISPRTPRPRTAATEPPAGS